jgi:hypothetical protein
MGRASDLRMSRRESNSGGECGMVQSCGEHCPTVEPFPGQWPAFSPKFNRHFVESVLALVERFEAKAGGRNLAPVVSRRTTSFVGLLPRAPLRITKVAYRVGWRLTTPHSQIAHGAWSLADVPS